MVINDANWTVGVWIVRTTVHLNDVRWERVYHWRSNNAAVGCLGTKGACPTPLAGELLGKG